MSDHGGHEIVIVKHAHGDHDEGHHGGAWKIAFADFMTAMMCFFLVMWLINASNDKTKAAVASYFNPVKLMDRNASRKGLEDVGNGPQPTGTKKDKSDSKQPGEAVSSPVASAETDKVSADATLNDQKLFADPYAVLAQIAAGEELPPNASTKGEGGAQEAGPATGASGGDAYKDPFAPDFWSQQVAAPSAAEATAIMEQAEQQPPTPKLAEPTPEEKAAMAAPGKSEFAAAEDPFAPPVAKPEPKTEAAADTAEEMPVEAEPAKVKPEAKHDKKHAGKKQAQEEPSPEAKAEPEPKAEAPAEEKPANTKPSEATIQAADKIRQELADALVPGDPLKNGISVVATKDGVKISVTDQLDFGMYEIGSAVPRRELVLAMEKISKAISDQKGDVTISGHTDARPFKGGGYDNWRLSSARAQSAYYMLVRAGLAEQRVTQVAGFADRKLKDAADPLSATNRRIEILLEIPQ